MTTWHQVNLYTTTDVRHISIIIDATQSYLIKNKLICTIWLTYLTCGLFKNTSRIFCIISNIIKFPFVKTITCYTFSIYYHHIFSKRVLPQELPVDIWSHCSETWNTNKQYNENTDYTMISKLIVQYVLVIFSILCFRNLYLSHLWCINVHICENSDIAPFSAYSLILW